MTVTRVASHSLSMLSRRVDSLHVSCTYVSAIALGLCWSMSLDWFRAAKIHAFSFWVKCLHSFSFLPWIVVFVPRCVSSIRGMVTHLSCPALFTGWGLVFWELEPVIEAVVVTVLTQRSNLTSASRVSCVRWF